MFGHKKGSGFLSPGVGGPVGPQQFNLVASEGFTGNGMATIGTDNSFSVIAHLPPVHTVSPHAPAVYAAYLVDAKGKNGFYAGTLKPAGNGVYQANFRSPVPLAHYNKVVVSMENPQGISQAPQGPIVMKVKGGLLEGFGPAKEKGSEMWGKVKGFFNERFGKGEAEVPEDYPEQNFETQQPQGQQQYTNSQYSGQQYTQQHPYPGQQYSQYGGGYPPPRNHIPQGGYSPQGGYPPQGSYPPPQGGFQQRFGAHPNQRLFGAGRPYQGQQGQYYGQPQPHAAPGQTYTQPNTAPPAAPSPASEPTPAPQVQDFGIPPNQEQLSVNQPQEGSDLEVKTD